MTTSELIWEYQRAIIDIYMHQNLNCLRGFEYNYTVNGREFLGWYSEATRKCAVKHKGLFNYRKLLDDILFCSDALLYFTAHLFLYLPFINNPLKDAIPTKESMVYPNIQNLEGKRYSMFADSASQQAYNYWDRIGDLIASFFPDKIKSANVFFPTAIEAIPTEFHYSENYKWLYEFKLTDYVELNKKRKQIVHYATSDTDFRDKHLKSVHDKEAIESLQNDREYLAEYYKNHISYTLNGFEKTLLFLDEITPTLFPDII
jgi:hypothetical protein